MKEIRKIIRECLSEGVMNKTLKIKDIILTPNELSDIFEICKNEINLSNNDLLMIEFYSAIYVNCLMQHNNLTDGSVDIISDVRNFFVKSNNEKEVKSQYKEITKPSHIFAATLLKMIVDYKKIDFVDEKLRRYSVIHIMGDLVKEKITNTTHYSDNFKKKLLSSKIEIIN